MDESTEQKPGKLIRKEGITYYLCQHLEEGAMEIEQAAIWLGDERRVILCPLCDKLEFGNQLMISYLLRGLSEKKVLKKFIAWRKKVIQYFLDKLPK